jgi:hypothetical protein
MLARKSLILLGFRWTKARKRGLCLGVAGGVGESHTQGYTSIFAADAYTDAYIYLVTPARFS